MFLRRMEMLTNFLNCILLVFFVNTSSSRADDGDPTLITLPYGQIKGHVLQTKNGNYYNAFQEIPYAAPPVNKLRYKEAVPPSKWYGILDTTQNTKICYQRVTSLIPPGLTLSEDCLYINVYAPANATEALPVFAWIHGGAFEIGDGTYQSYGPAFLIDYDIVVVTMNYRLGALGFLATEDGVIPGNLGLKDQNLALQWVKQNIELFGGDPERVTIGGASSGAASVGLQVVSKKSQGLFRGAILQSGTAISPFCRQPFARDLAFELGRTLDSNFTSEDSTDLLNLLQSVPAADIVNSGVTSHWEKDAGFPAWAPVIEDENDENAFITGPMHDDIKNGNINQVPILTGFNSEEEITFAVNIELTNVGLEALIRQGIIYDNDVSSLVDIAFNIAEEDKYTAGSELRKIYTDGTFGDDVGALIRYLSDLAFTTPAIRQADLESNYTDVYLYQFSYNGALGRILLGGDQLDIEGVDPNGVGHGAETFYIWMNLINTDIEIFPARDRLIQSYLLKMWTNFVKYLNPTPEPDTALQNIIWSKVTPGKLNYLDINSTLSIQTDPKEYSKWEEIIDKYAIPPLIIY